MGPLVMDVLKFLIAFVGGLVVATPSVAESNVPTQQSDCEIRANKFRALHPHADPMNYLRFGFDYFGGTAPPNPPQTYRDSESGLTFHVKADGRRITATDASGKLIWVHNPFVESNMCPYRSAHPYIAWVGAVRSDFGNAEIVKELDSEIARGRKVDRPEDTDRFIGLSFKSSQSGYLNIRNGYFYLMGQN